MLAAAAAIALAAAGRIELALVGLMFAGLADLFDGVVARRLRRNDYAREFGVQLDTVGDVVSFIVTPVVIALHAVPPSLPGIAAIGVFMVAGVVRLAHFNTLSVRAEHPSGQHRGLPVTYTALLFPLLFLLQAALPAAQFAQLLAFAFGLLALLFVVDIPVPRPGRVFYVLLPLLAAGLIAYWVWRSFV
ncbi:hypothetical protein THITH_17375 [Thioalkalivibrio paradoxus ARh 1]|uniref:CDP-alcohol phosphatidyltransferase n=1 Tax=Thioalkalivibrio paradoxus ARh 1 TaxID=713585 RepID=W0DPF3_9GAMM|nr:hypothetical protein THITH_17375 [Thioalkalivibrio paradoxus ARh 1]